MVRDYSKSRCLISVYALRDPAQYKHRFCVSEFSFNNNIVVRMPYRYKKNNYTVNSAALFWNWSLVFKEQR